ncbi:MAG: flagellin, partial [Gammaproteobacteria bacterium]|nr:flagellin [Gammaproteobacteria bacterium]
LDDTSGASLNAVATAINNDTALQAAGYAATVNGDDALVITNSNGDVTADLRVIGLNAAGEAIPAANAAPATEATMLTDSGSIDVNGETVSWTAGQTMQDVLDQFGTGELANVKAELGENGRLTLTSEKGESVKLADVSGGSLQQLGLSSGETKAVLKENTSINLNGTEVRLAKGSDMDAIVTAINTASTGVSASANEDGTLKLFSGNESFTVADGSEGTGLAALGLTDVASEHKGVVVESSISNLDITSAEGAQQAISVLDGAMQQIDSERAKLGAVQNRFESTISNLQNIAENASNARSRILDTDYAAESANLAKNQIMQQAGTAMLAQANQLPQAVLSLLG